MKLKVNESKSGIRRPHEINFLGHSIHGKGKLGLSTPSMQCFKRKQKEKTRQNLGISLDQMVKELNPLMRGWLNYFKRARMKGKLKVLMRWLSRRFRCFRLQQCKRALRIARFLQKLKVPEWRSWLLASTREDGIINPIPLKPMKGWI